jgi:CheY-like chemotaxis protein
MKVIFLDDDKVYLRMLEQYVASSPENPFSSRGIESKFTSHFAHVLTLLQTEEIDLLVTDFDMPENDGLQVLEVLSDVFPHVTTAIATCHVEESYRKACWETEIEKLPKMQIAGYEAYRKACLRAGAQIYLAKPSTIEEIDIFLTRLLQLLPDAKTQSNGAGVGPDGFTGVVRKASLFDIIQMLCLSCGEFTLEVRSFTRQGNIFISGGQVIHCESEGLSGRDALFSLLADRSGEFDMKPGVAAVERTIYESWDSLVLEAAKTQDEISGSAG